MSQPSEVGCIRWSCGLSESLQNPINLYSQRDLLVPTFKMPGDSVRIVEVGPRDGLQNIKDVVPTATKIELINRLSQTGLRTIEATSFVSPKWVPQLSDAKTVMESMKLSVAEGDISFPVLVPNMKGLEAALALDVKEIGIFLSATEGFSRNNINCSVEESLVRAQGVVEKARAQNVRVRG